MRRAAHEANLSGESGDARVPMLAGGLDALKWFLAAPGSGEDRRCRPPPGIEGEVADLTVMQRDAGGAGA